MELIPGAGVIAPVGAQMQVAETSGEWAVRPAAEANPLMQSTDATASPSVPPSDARSLEIKTDGGIRYIAGGIGERGRSGLNAISQDSTCT